MPYPVVGEDLIKSWYLGWRDDCEKAWARVTPTASPQVMEQDTGAEFDWATEVAAIIGQLRKILEEEGDKVFEVRGAKIIHQALPDHAALRDPEFWYWMAVVPGRELVELRYPYQEEFLTREDWEASGKKKKPPFLPGRANFVSPDAKEVLFFRLWIRAEMSRLFEDSDDDAYNFTRGGTEFWRSHLLRVLYAQHRPFLQAFVDFQYPGPDRDKPALGVEEIRQLAKDLAKACANVSVELLDRNQSKALIERVWTRTSSARAWVKG